MISDIRSHRPFIFCMRGKIGIFPKFAIIITALLTWLCKVLVSFLNLDEVNWFGKFRLYHISTKCSTYLSKFLVIIVTL